MLCFKILTKINNKLCYPTLHTKSTKSKRLRARSLLRARFLATTSLPCYDVAVVEPTRPLQKQTKDV